MENENYSFSKQPDAVDDHATEEEKLKKPKSSTPTTPQGQQHSEQEEQDSENQEQLDHVSNPSLKSPIVEEDKKSANNFEVMPLSDDPTKVKFTNSAGVAGSPRDEETFNGEAKVDIENVQVAFAGMGKDELMKFANDPFWIRLRWVLFLLFWIVWLAMLAGAVIIVVLAEKCKPLPVRDWWQKGVVYQSLVPSFKDTDDNGYGDIKGIEYKLDYLSDLGVSAILLSPVFESAMKDFGYDISNFTAIDSKFGTMEDFDNLMKKAKEKNLKVILDYVPNHTSVKHPWFISSVNREEPYTDFYIWADGTGSDGRQPPNNWLSVFNTSAWKFDTTRRQSYYHAFLLEQPDLNYRNPLVREEMKKVLRFWLDKGVDGFRMDAVVHLFEDSDLKSEPRSLKPNILQDEYDYLIHNHTRDQPEVFDVIKEWRSVLNEYKEKDGHQRVLIAEVYADIQTTMSYYGNETEPIADFPFNFQLLELKEEITSHDVNRTIRSWIDNQPEGTWANWLLGNHDTSRFGSRLHPDLIDGFHMLTMLIGGTSFTYYGEEIGMVDGEIPAEMKDKPTNVNMNRDPERTPMQWNNQLHAGFSNASHPWLPVNSNYEKINVEAQKDDANSHVNIYKKLVSLRNEQAILYGDTGFPVITNETFSFARAKRGSPGFIVVMNVRNENVTISLAEKCCNEFSFPEEGLVEVRSANMNPSSPLAKIRAKIPLNNIALGPYESVVIKIVPTFK